MKAQEDPVSVALSIVGAGIMVVPLAACLLVIGVGAGVAALGREARRAIQGQPEVRQLEQVAVERENAIRDIFEIRQGAGEQMRQIAARRTIEGTARELQR